MNDMRLTRKNLTGKVLEVSRVDAEEYARLVSSFTRIYRNMGYVLVDDVVCTFTFEVLSKGNWCPVEITPPLGSISKSEVWAQTPNHSTAEESRKLMATMNHIICLSLYPDKTLKGRKRVTVEEFSEIVGRAKSIKNNICDLGGGDYCTFHVNSSRLVLSDEVLRMAARTRERIYTKTN